MAYWREHVRLCGTGRRRGSIRRHALPSGPMISSDGLAWLHILVRPRLPHQREIYALAYLIIGPVGGHVGALVVAVAAGQPAHGLLQNRLYAVST